MHPHRTLEHKIVSYSNWFITLCTGPHSPPGMPKIPCLLISNNKHVVDGGGGGKDAGDSSSKPGGADITVHFR